MQLNFSARTKRDLHSVKTRGNPLLIMLIVIAAIYGIYWYNNFNKTRTLEHQMIETKSAPAGKIFDQLFGQKDSPYKNKINFTESWVKINYWKSNQIIAQRNSSILELPLPDTAYSKIWKQLPDSASFKVVLDTKNEIISKDTLKGAIRRKGGKWLDVKLHN